MALSSIVRPFEQQDEIQRKIKSEYEIWRVEKEKTLPKFKRTIPTGAGEF